MVAAAERGYRIERRSERGGSTLLHWPPVVDDRGEEGVDVDLICQNGHTVTGPDRFCRLCGSPASRSKVATGSATDPVASGLRCPNDHPASGHEIYCKQCGMRIDDTKGVPNEVSHSPTKTVAAPSGHSSAREPSRANATEQPSVTPTLITTIFFGLVGLWPAIRHSNMAHNRGLRSSRYWWAFSVPIAAYALLGAATASAVALGAGATPAPRHAIRLSPVATSVPASTSTLAPATTTTTLATAPPITAPIQQTAEMQANWTYDPNKCGPKPTPQTTPYSASQTYRVTATIHLWSGPTTSSTPLAIIDVTTYGPGGIGCPIDGQPLIIVACATTGETITGPFGPDAIWEQTTWNGQTGYVPDEWVDTQWDAKNFSPC